MEKIIVQETFKLRIGDIRRELINEYILGTDRQGKLCWIIEPKGAL